MILVACAVAWTFAYVKVPWDLRVTTGPLYTQRAACETMALHLSTLTPSIHLLRPQEGSWLACFPTPTPAPTSPPDTLTP